MMTDNAYQPGDRRPLASRDTSWAGSIAAWLAGKNISPNTISTFSMVFAALAFFAMWGTLHASGIGLRLLWLLALLGIQLRLLANLFDGMVAVNTQQASPLGELFNEIPDRVSDTFILMALGFTVGGSMAWAITATLLALFVSYIRAVGAAAGAGQVFAGVMAKPKRMFVVSVLCVLHILLPTSWTHEELLWGLGIDGLGVMIISLGCVITAFTRLTTMTQQLHKAQ